VQQAAAGNASFDHPFEPAARIGLPASTTRGEKHDGGSFVALHRATPSRGMQRGTFAAVAGGGID
jgi:hypothetical protein